MDEPAGRTAPNRAGSGNENRLRHAVDAGFLTGTREEEDFSDSDSCDAASESTRLADLSASFRVFSESLLRRELAEMEMMKSREALRCEAEKRRMESEAELTRMMVQTQLQTASFVAAARKSPSRKRKRAQEEEEEEEEDDGESPPLSQRQILLIPLTR